MKREQFTLAEVLPSAGFLLHFDRRRIALSLALGLLTAGLLLALGGGRAALEAIARADWQLVSLGALIHYSGFALRGHRWQLLLGAMGYRLPYTRVVSLLLAGWFASALLPARAGDALRIGGLRLPATGQVVAPVAHGLSSIALERALDILAILSLGAGFSLSVLYNQLPGWVLAAYEIGLGMLAALGAILIGMPALLPRLRRWFTHQFWQAALRFAGQAAAALRALNPLLIALAVIESLAIWLCDAILLWLVLRSLSQPLPFAAAAFVALTLDVLVAVPLTPGGLGQIEATYVALFALLPWPMSNIPTVILATRAITYWSFLVISGAAVFIAGSSQLFVDAHRPVSGDLDFSISGSSPVTDGEKQQ